MVLFDWHWQVIEHYDLSVTVLGFTIFGVGEATIKIVEPRLKLTLEVNAGLITGVTIISADATVGISAFESGLTGVFHDDYLNDFINLFLGELIPQLLETFEADISEFISALIVEVGNQIFDDINIGDLFPMDEIIKLSGGSVPEVAAA